jgi:hypothetical protein
MANNKTRAAAKAAALDNSLPAGSIIIEDADKVPDDITSAIVLEDRNLIRDLRSHAVVNRDHSGYTAAMVSKTYHRMQRDEVKSLREKIDNLESILIRLLPAEAPSSDEQSSINNAPTSEE